MSIFEYISKHHESMKKENNITQRQWLKIEEVHLYVPLGERAIRDLIKEGRIKSVKPAHGPTLTKKEWIDEYLETESSSYSESEQIAKEILYGSKGKGKT
jgi:hypothetical protein